ncbi:MAG: ATP-grasp domain-containing protein [Clostridia bacterium]|nr:ATP-grasp domain-containing protein [Clostridia bacterium]
MRIWFNHWFSTVFHLINLIKKGSPNQFTVIGSNENDSVVYKNACDEWYTEPRGLSDAEYISYCLEFCKQHKVDVFLPYKKLRPLSQAHQQFKEAGVTLFLDEDAFKLKILGDKAATYDYFLDCIPEHIPEYKLATSFEEFVAAYELLSQKAERVCYKLVEDEGARSFRVIDNRIESIQGLLEKPGVKITLEAAKKILSGYDFKTPLLLMPYLSGIEVSIDCITTPSGDIIIPRFKTNKRYSEIIFEEKLMRACKQVLAKLAFKKPLNVQFKFEGDNFYLLEINPRMSGGLQLSCLATGINVPDIAINAARGIHKEWNYPNYYTQKVVHIETPICLD